MSRILLADDSPQALRHAEQILTSHGMQVVSVTDGDVLLRRLADVSPDVVISDVYLASKSAFEIARYMRAQAQYRDVPIIFAASPMDQFDEQDARHAGADVILRKPFEASLLLGTVQELLERTAAARQPSHAEVNQWDRNSVRAAVTLALDSAMPALIEELTQRVMAVLHRR